MAISFTENIEELRVTTKIVENQEVKIRKIRLTATRIDAVTGSSIPVKQIAWVSNVTELTALAIKVGDEIAAKISAETAKAAMIADYKTKFHDYLIAREDLK